MGAIKKKVITAINLNTNPILYIVITNIPEIAKINRKIIDNDSDKLSIPNI